MSRVRIPLDLIDSSVTGIYMENLISCWCDRGLTLKHAEVLASVLSTWTKRDDLFIRCLEKEKSLFEEMRGRIMRSLDIWEEVPAWDEVWRLKLAFDRDRKIDWHPNVKLYAVIVCKLLPEMIVERSKDEYSWGTRAKDLINLSCTPSWYQEKVEQYQARQAEREKARLRDQEAMLRYRALTRGDFSVFVQLAQVLLPEDELERLLEEPRLYPLDWWASLEKAGVNTWSYKPSDSSPSASKASSSGRLPIFGNPSNTTVFGGTSPLPPDFTSKASSSGRLPIFGNPSNTLFGGTSPLPPDFTSSASKAPSYTTVFGGTSNKLFGSASPLPPDFTSSASKASSSTKAPLFGTREHGSPVSVSQGPEQVKSGGNLGVTVSDSVESEGS